MRRALVGRQKAVSQEDHGAAASADRIPRMVYLMLKKRVCHLKGSWGNSSVKGFIAGGILRHSSWLIRRLNARPCCHCNRLLRWPSHSPLTIPMAAPKTESTTTPRCLLCLRHTECGTCLPQFPQRPTIDSCPHLPMLLVSRYVPLASVKMEFLFAFKFLTSTGLFTLS